MPFTPPTKSPPEAPADPPTMAYLEQLFGDYYRRRPQFRVQDLSHREWMMDPFQGRLFRHTALQDETQLHAFVTQRTPQHVYHSLAAYRDPTIREMSVKHHGRLRWEVLLDIDVKPEPRLDGAGHESLSDALLRARQQFLATLAILEDDVGLPMRKMDACFSGAKGYHARLTSEELQQISPEARSEIGRLVGGSNTYLPDLFPALRKGRALFPTEAPRGGLKRRIFLAMMRLRTMATTTTRSPALLGLCRRHNQSMADPSVILDRIRDAPTMQTLLDSEDDDALVEVWYRMAQHLACPSIDQSAIADVSRMVRLQGSLNGKTGLICKPLASIEEVERFDPLTDANPHPRDVETRITGARDLELAAGGDTYRVRSGEVAKLPLHIAIIFVATGGARLAEAPPATYST